MRDDEQSFQMRFMIKLVIISVLVTDAPQPWKLRSVLLISRTNFYSFWLVLPFRAMWSIFGYFNDQSNFSSHVYSMICLKSPFDNFYVNYDWVHERIQLMVLSYEIRNLIIIEILVRHNLIYFTFRLRTINALPRSLLYWTEIHLHY